MMNTFIKYIAVLSMPCMCVIVYTVHIHIYGVYINLLYMYTPNYLLCGADIYEINCTHTYINSHVYTCRNSRCNLRLYFPDGLYSSQKQAKP